MQVLERLGFRNVGEVYSNLPTSALYEEIVQRREAHLADLGPIVVRTGHHTGRSPDDKFIVDEPSSREHVSWGDINRPFDAAAFDRLYQRQLAYLQDNDLFIQDCYVGADARYRVRLRVVTETAWHALFARTMFRREPDREKLAEFEPDFTIVHTPRFHAVPDIDGTASEVFILVNFARRLVLIGGTSYAGEIKKSAFTIMNYVLPVQQVMGMHCSANYGRDKDDVALFFGLSGTGKTTLSTAPDRTLIGDDEHGWSEDGVFNFEGGCYAKVIGITPNSEPDIYQTTQKFGTILENVTMDMRTRRLDLQDSNLTENTRAAYPLTHIPRADPDGVAGHPKNVIFLTYDAFGVLPPVSRLTPDQASYHFLCGYTSKVAGTEKGVNEPRATFSACFGAPFMPLRPQVYGELLAKKIARHGTNCWLINTGLTGGPYGVGNRISLTHTRAIVSAILDGRLAEAASRPEPRFELSVVQECPDVPDAILEPQNTWSDPSEYERRAQQLADRFEETHGQYAKMRARTAGSTH